MKIKVKDNKITNVVSEKEAIQAYEIKKEKAHKLAMERLQNGLSLRMPAPTTEDEIIKLADELTEWSKLPDEIKTGHFINDMLIDLEGFRQLPDKSKYFNDAYHKVLLTLKKRRNDGVKSGRYSKIIAQQMNRMESPEFLKYLREKKRAEMEVENGKA